MIDHTGIKVRDLARSNAFYRAALAPLGYQLLMEFSAEVTGADAVAGFGVPPKPDFWLAAGGRDNGAPGQRPYYHADYYGAFVLDPDGHNIEVVCHDPA